MTTTLEVRLLGPLRVSVSGRPVRLPAGRLSALLAVLAMAAGQPVSADRLAAAVWGEDPAVDARTNVHTNVRRLRRLLGAEMVSTLGGGYALNVEPDQVDALRFIRILNAAAITDDPAGRRHRLAEALSLWRDTPFDDLQSDWLEQTELPRLQERYLTGLERRVDLDLAERPLTDLAAELSELTRRHPLRESLWVRLLVVLGQTGRSAEALERYEEIRAHIADELGTDPGPELQRVYANLLAGDAPALPGTASSPPPEVVPPEVVPRQVVPRQLPAGTDAFIGRDEPLKALDALLPDEDEARRRPVVVAAMTGTAGVGKTTLAIHWAHRVADRFPDGTLYVNLRGFDPSGAPVEPADAIRRFLDALRVPPSMIPAGPEAQVAAYRSLVAGKRLLLVLDNARDADQVAPLLPGSPGCFVLVTSRNQLTGLITTGAHPVSLDLPSHDEAVHLLARRLSPDRVAAEPAAIDEIVTRCARLPLALAIVAARAATHPAFRLAALADELRDAPADPADRADPIGLDGEAGPDEHAGLGSPVGLAGLDTPVGLAGLDSLDGGETTANARAVFSWSYQHLDPAAARLFRLLGLHPGPDLTMNAAASLAGRPVAELRPLLAELTRANLLAEHAPGRYTCHDLLRAYSRELAAAHDSDADRHSAVHRMLDHYLHIAHGADLLLFQHGEPVVLPTPRPGVVVQRLSDRDQALTWFSTEHPVLLAVIATAVRLGFDHHAYHLALAMFVFQHRRGYWQDRATTQRVALDAARRLDDHHAQARAHRYLGSALADLSEFADAHVHLQRALDISVDVDDPVEQAWTHYYRDLVHGLQGHDAKALDAAQHALDLFEAAHDRVGQAIALTDVGWYHGRLGNHQHAVTLCTRALTLHQELDNRAYQAHTWSCLGDIYQSIGDHASALDGYRNALGLFRDVGDRYGEAGALTNLGELHHHLGDAAAAREARRAAQDIIGELDAPAASQLRTLRNQPDQPGQPGQPDQPPPVSPQK